MAGETLSTILNALSQVMAPDLYRQWNRTTYLLRMLQARTGAITDGIGKNCAFDVEFTGATAQTVAEGSDVPASEFAQDINEPMLMPWATYRTSFQISEQEVDAARTSVGTADALRDLFGARLLSANAILARQIESDMLTGTGVDGNGNPTLIGVFGGALTASGAYGGLSPATYSEWASTQLTNGGTARTLTPALMASADQLIFTAASLPWNAIVTSAGVVSKYEQFFTTGAAFGTQQPLIRMQDNPASPQYGMGVPNDPTMQLTNLYWKGQPVVRNPVAPTGKMAFLNTDFIKIKYLPHVPTRNEIEFLENIGLQGSTGGNQVIQATGLQARIVELGKTGDSHKLSARITLAAAFVRRNAMAIIQDISET